MSQELGGTTGRGGVRIPSLEMTGWRVTPRHTVQFLSAVVLRNNFHHSPLNYDRPHRQGLNSHAFENPYDELYLPPTHDKPAGLIRSRKYLPLDRSQPGTRYYEFLTAPRNNRAGAFVTAMTFEHHLTPEQDYGIAGYLETLDAKTGKTFVRTRIFDGGPDLTMYGQPMQRYLIEERDSQGEDQKRLARVMRDCVTFLSE